MSIKKKIPSKLLERLKKKGVENSENLILVHYTVNFGARKRHYPEEVELLCEKCHPLMEDPTLADYVKPLEELKEKYPDAGIIYNYLVNAYAHAGEGKKSFDVMVECFKKFPKYPNGVITYLYQMIERGNLDEVGAIFDKKFEIGLMFPERKEFHITEITAFNVTLFKFYVTTSQIELAEPLLMRMKDMKIDEKIPSTLLQMYSYLKLKQVYFHKN